MGFLYNLFNCNKIAYENDVYKRRLGICESEIDSLRLTIKKIQKVVHGNSPIIDAPHVVEQDLFKDDSRQALVKKHVVKKNDSTNVPQFAGRPNRTNASFIAPTNSNDHYNTNDNFVMGLAVGSMMSDVDNRHHSVPADAPSSSGYDSTPSYDSGSSFDCGSSGGDCGGGSCGGD